MAEERKKENKNGINNWAEKRADTNAFGSFTNGAGNALFIYLVYLFIIIKYNRFADLTKLN